MTFLQAFVLGLFQGLTEFLPVSSTAHMDIVPQLLFHMKDPGAAFSAVVQLGPIIAIVFYFRNDLVKYLQGIIRTKSPMNIPAKDLDARLGWYTLLGTLPLAAFGLLLEKKIDKDFRDLKVVSASLIVLALVMLAAEMVGKRNRKLSSLTWKDTWLIGFSQVLALIPGTSRSGVTITSGLFLGLDREGAARFSFLLSIPAITAAGLYKLVKTVKTEGLGGDAATYVFGAVVAAVVAYVIVNWFLKYMKEHSTMGFIVYRIALGVFILGMVATHHL